MSFEKSGSSLPHLRHIGGHTSNTREWFGQARTVVPYVKDFSQFTFVMEGCKEVDSKWSPAVGQEALGTN